MARTRTRSPRPPPFPTRAQSSSTSLPSTTSSFQTPPPSTSFAQLSFPAPHVLLVTLSRPASLNCINAEGHHELAAVWAWLDNEPSLRVGIVTGAGKAFCVGADLKEWSNTLAAPSSSRPQPPPSGFGGLSRRVGKKPIIAAVNGACLGGGFEMAVNCDLVLASSRAVFALPEAKVGVVAMAGALPRLTRIVGRQKAMEMALTGRNVSADEARQWGLVNAVTGEGVVKKAVELGTIIAGNSPDSVIVSKAGIEEGWKDGGVEEGTERLVRGIYQDMEAGENMKEGINAFVEKRRPKWVD
ncbi:hypothetical protein MMC22_012117, partial [Lobaria immixta]|nr:hypothetical protein [Lobaria immixta]